MLIKREVIERMYEHFKGELTFRYQGADDYVDLFAPIIDESGLYLSEDFAFCKRAKSIGFKTFMSKRFELPHLGQMEYSAEHEAAFLDDYEKSGRITINKDKPVNYFAAFNEKESD